MRVFFLWSSEDFRLLSEDFLRFPKLFRRPHERSRTFSQNFRKFPKMSEDFRRLPKTFEVVPEMFRWYTNKFKYKLKDKLDISGIVEIFTCEDIISSHQRISHRFYHFVTTRYTTDFYIIKCFIMIIALPIIDDRLEIQINENLHYWRLSTCKS